jgi:RNA polymerase sigma-70 factor, ECF subfamily
MDHASGQGGSAPSDGLSGAQRRVAALYDAHVNWMFRHALMILGNHAGAEDAVQQVFTKLMRMGDGVERIAAAEPYLRQAVRHECYRSLRKTPRHEPRPSHSDLLEPVDPNVPDDGTRQELESALRHLPAEQREVVHLKVYEGMTFQQVATVLNIPANTAASRYRYAMEKLRSILDARGR